MPATTQRRVARRALIAVALATVLAVGGLPGTVAAAQATIILRPATLLAGYPAGQPVTVLGSATSFEDGVTEVTVSSFTFDENGFQTFPIPDAVGDVAVVDETTLVFELDAELGADWWVVDVQTGDEWAGTFLVVDRADIPAIQLDPSSLFVGYEPGLSIDVTGFGTSFENGVTEVVVASWDFVDDVFTTFPEEGAVGTVEVHDEFSLTFSLEAELEPAFWHVQVTTGDELAGTFLPVAPLSWPDPQVPSIELDPSALPEGYKAPRTITVHGTDTSFEAGVTTVQVSDWTWEDDVFELHPIEGAVGAVVVESPTRLTFQLRTTLPPGLWHVQVTTGDEQPGTFLDVGGPWGEPDPPQTRDDCLGWGWEWRTDSDGTPFSSLGHCIAYLAR
jgi:hypothetical protein